MVWRTCRGCSSLLIGKLGSTKYSGRSPFERAWVRVPAKQYWAGARGICVSQADICHVDIRDYCIVLNGVGITTRLLLHTAAEA